MATGRSLVSVISRGTRERRNGDMTKAESDEFLSCLYTYGLFIERPTFLSEVPDAVPIVVASAGYHSVVNPGP